MEINIKYDSLDCLHLALLTHSHAPDERQEEDVKCVWLRVARAHRSECSENIQINCFLNWDRCLEKFKSARTSHTAQGTHRWSAHSAGWGEQMLTSIGKIAGKCRFGQFRARASSISYFHFSTSSAGCTILTATQLPKNFLRFSLLRMRSMNQAMPQANRQSTNI